MVLSVKQTYSYVIFKYLGYKYGISFKKSLDKKNIYYYIKIIIIAIDFFMFIYYNRLINKNYYYLHRRN